MKKTIPVRLEEVEIKLLDWLVERLGFGSRSDLIRYVIRNLAEKFSAPLIKGKRSVEGN